MRGDTGSVRKRPVRALAATVLLALLVCLAPEATGAESAWRTLAEMQPPEGVVVDEATVREGLTASAEGVDAVARVEAAMTEEWEALAEIDWVALSRYQLEATQGWELPDAPGELVSRVLGRDARGRLHVETRGPRLPARFDIVYRYVYVFTTYDPLTGDIDDRVATIRGWVEE